MANGKFGLRAYYPNYWIVSYTDKSPKGDPALQDPTIDGTHYIHTETKFQISVRADYVTDWFGFTQMWTGAYTQTSYWQLFIESSPFREINYKPELFVTFPFYHKLDSIGMKAISFGYKHSSNGQPDSNSTVRVREDGPYEGSRSRSWNRLYIRGYFQWNNFFGELTVWHRIEEDYATNDNPDIEDFYGQGSLEIAYIREKLLTRVTMRQSFKSGHFSGELEMSHPLPLSDNVFFYLQASTGYGQSLIDYDRHVNQVGFGLSISR
jgi:phospholipase A1